MCDQKLRGVSYIIHKTYNNENNEEYRYSVHEVLIAVTIGSRTLILGIRNKRRYIREL